MNLHNLEGDAQDHVIERWFIVCRLKVPGRSGHGDRVVVTKSALQNKRATDRQGLHHTGMQTTLYASKFNNIVL